MSSCSGSTDCYITGIVAVLLLATESEQVYKAGRAGRGSRSRTIAQIEHAVTPTPKLQIAVALVAVCLRCSNVAQPLNSKAC